MQNSAENNGVGSEILAVMEEDEYKQLSTNDNNKKTQNFSSFYKQQ